MRGAALPAALLFAVLAMALSFASWRVRLVAVATTIVVACVVAAIALPAGWAEAAFAGCWISLALVGLSVYLPKRIAPTIHVGMAAIAGLWAGAVIALEGAPADLARALPVLALVVPGAWLVHRGWQIALKVATSWAIAIALLSALLPTTTATPGYRPDHME